MSTVAEIVKPTFITVAPEDTLGEVAEKMSERNVGAVVVKDFGRLIGIRPGGGGPGCRAPGVHTAGPGVGNGRKPDPMTAGPDMSLDDAAQIMLDNGFRHLPVVDGSAVLGIVSLRRVLGGRRQPAPEAA